MRTFGTQATGIRMPIIREGDDLPQIVTDSIINYSNESGIAINDRDIIGITEAIAARAQGNYATSAQIAADLKSKFDTNVIGIVFPIMSRNRFEPILKGITAAFDEVYIQLSYPADEVGNHLVTENKTRGVNTHSEVFTEEEFRVRFGELKHEITDIDYLKLYRESGKNVKIILANDPCVILKYSKNIIAADIHTRAETKQRLVDAGADKVLGLDDILTESCNGSGYNKQYGLLGSNKSGNDRIKLFPHSCDELVRKVQRLMYERCGAKVEVLVYGDGAYKDPVGKIWELADPVVSPGYTEGLSGFPHEIKLKYVADSEFADKRGEEAREAIIECIRKKDEHNTNEDISGGTTPRRLVDLIGSLCDLMSGSGDKGTPVIFIKGYFDNYASE